MLIYPIALALLSLTWAGGLALDHRLEEVAPRKVAGAQGDKVIFQGKALKVMSLGYEQALATYYWLKLIQYCAYSDTNSLPMKQVYPMVRIINSLGLHYYYVYEFSWLNLMYYDVRPLEIRKREGEKILRMGFYAAPDSWRLAQDYGFHLFYYQHEYAKAANLYDRAYRLRKFPLYAQLATSLSAHGKGPEAALMGLRIQLSSTADEDVKKELKRQIKRVKAEEIAQELDKYIDIYVQKVGHCPESLEVLVKEGLIRHVPSDGIGGTYRLDKEDCKAESTTIGRLKVYMP